ncbi:MAG: hypothetical protein QM680_01015 [Luteolibacter sp.]
MNTNPITAHASPSHASGPWIVDEGDCPALGAKALAVLSESHQPGARGEAICIVSLLSKTSATDRENARLIAAAPDLLRELETAHGWINRLHEWMCGDSEEEISYGELLDAMAGIKAAIGKARGGNTTTQQ